MMNDKNIVVKLFYSEITLRDFSFSETRNTLIHSLSNLKTQISIFQRRRNDKIKEQAAPREKCPSRVRKKSLNC